MKSVWCQADPSLRLLSSYSVDFQVLVGQGLDEVGVTWERDDDFILPVFILVDSRPIEDALGEDPDWDRYLWDALQHFQEAGMFSGVDDDGYDTVAFQHPDMKIVGEEAFYEAGFRRYVDQLAISIKACEDVPPIVLLGGQFFDGRHRIHAARNLGRLDRIPAFDLLDVEKVRT